MRSKRSKNNVNSQIGKIYKNRKRNIAIVILIAFCLFIIYKINFLTKSEETVKLTSVKFIEYLNNTELTDNVEIHEDENGTYIILPEKVQGLYAQKYYMLDSNEENISKNQNEIIQKQDQNVNTTLENVVTEMQNQIENTSIIQTNTDDTDTNSLFDKAVQGNQKDFLSSNEQLPENEEETNQEENSDENKDNDNTETEPQKPSDSENIQNEVSQNIVTEDITNEQTNTVTNTEVQNIVENTNEIKEQEKNENKVENTTVNEQTNILTKSENETLDINGKTYSPGEKLYLDKDVLDKNLAQITVEYQTLEINNLKLYKQELNAEDNSVNVKVTGYIPLNYALNIVPQDLNQISELKSDVEELDEAEVLLAYDIKIISGEQEYQPKDYYQTVEVEINSTEKLAGKIKTVPVQVIHIAENARRKSYKF